MLKIRKVTAIIIAVMMVFTFTLTGCGNNDKDVAQTSDAQKKDVTKANDVENEDVKKEKPYEILWYSIGTPQNDVDLVFEEVSKYTKDKINATVKLRMFDWGEYDKRMPVIIASGEKFDICFTCSWANNYIQNSVKGAFVELDELIDKYGKEIKQVVHPAFWEGAKVNGHIYAIPANKELGKQSVWRFNKKYIDKYNMDISKVKSLESLEPLLETIKQNEPKEIMPISADKSMRPYLPFDYIISEDLPFVMYLDTDDYKVFNKWEAPETLETLKTMHSYYNKGYIRKDVASVTSGEDEQTGNWFVGKCDTQPCADLLWSRSLGYDVISAPMQDPTISTGSCTGSMQAISITSDNPEKSMQFLNLVNTDKHLRNLIDSGIEGTHYELVDGKQKNLPAAKDRYDMPTFSLGNIFLTYLYENDPEDKWEQFEEFNNAGINAPTLGFVCDIKPFETELTAIRNISAEFESSLNTGSVDPEEYLPKAIKKLKAADVDKVIAEIQKQIDEWRASK